MTETDLSAVLEQARQLRRNRAFGPALALFDRNRSRFGEDGRFLADNALALAEAGHARAAATVMEQAIAAARDDLPVLLDAARLYVLTGRPQRALELCGQARALGEPTALLLSIQGDAFYQAGLPAEAKRAYEEAVALDAAIGVEPRLETASKRLAWLEAARLDPVLSGADVPAAARHGGASDVSVVLPVTPGTGSIEPVLRALALQSLQGFDVHVVAAASDAATADATGAWRGKLDITLHTVDGAPCYAALANRALALSGRDYVLLASAKDRFSARYVEALHSRIKSAPQIAFCHAGAVAIDAQGALHDIQRPQQPYEASPDKPVESALVVMRHFGDPNQVHGLYSRSSLDRTGGMPFVFGGDHVLAFLTAMTGAVAYVDEPLYYCRVDAEDLDRNRATERRIRDFSLDAMNGVERESAYSSLDYLAPFVDMARAHVEAASRAPVPVAERKRIADAVPGIFAYRFGPSAEDDARRIALFLDENEARIGGLAAGPLRARLVENLLVRVLGARTLLPGHPGLAESLKRTLALIG
jgi:tetratricopeptide (TPR) repeat protein